MDSLARRLRVEFEERFKDIRDLSHKDGVFYLGELLPEPLVKGSQPAYIDGTEGIPVINTLSIQKLKINTDDCRYISEDDFEDLPDARKLKQGDVLGKAYVKQNDKIIAQTNLISKYDVEKSGFFDNVKEFITNW